MTAFVERQLGTPQPHGTAVAEGRQGTVVAGKNDERVFIQAEGFQAGHEPADLGIYLHQYLLQVGHFFRVTGMGLHGFGVGNPGRMHVVEPQVNERRTTLIFSQKVQGFIHKVGRAVPAL